ncbi:hypothetical protein [Lishizhenia sp.]|uniref:gliding motility lipoprotein GldD n=1 Tax=Lishizhenia sp. TaxID=2497594 RepID=UPI00299D1651|nr:hypothetical protein [Lishizhenia sp.]MDX1445923.1 hypothetical protein [Lishizhenia sp.]
MMWRITSVFIVLSLLFVACEDENYIPKPSTYFKLNFPERVYKNYQDTCGFSFTIPSYFEVVDKKDQRNPCNRDINFKGLNGTLFLSYIPMETELYRYIDYSLSKVDEHKIKASFIKDTTLLYPEHGVYGTYFFLGGDVAKPIQFYLTDSSDIFMSGYVMFNAVPSYDSIKPVLNFVEEDILKMLESTKF